MKIRIARSTILRDQILFSSHSWYQGFKNFNAVVFKVQKLGHVSHLIPLVVFLNFSWLTSCFILNSTKCIELGKLPPGTRNTCFIIDVSCAWCSMSMSIPISSRLSFLETHPAHLLHQPDGRRGPFLFLKVQCLSNGKMGTFLNSVISDDTLNSVLCACVRNTKAAALRCSFCQRSH